MYVCTYDGFLSFSPSPSFFSPLSPSGKERLDWRLGGSDRGYSKRCQTVQALARDFRLGLAGGGWDDCKLELSSSTGQSNLNLLTHW